jgi:Arc/MetJ-type ribon-helix-helix transcriptional regulator
MKLSVSLSNDDVAFLDDIARTRSLGSRSAALQVAVCALREQSLVEAYLDAYLDADPDAELWDVTSGDGIAMGEATPVPRGAVS